MDTEKLAVQVFGRCPIALCATCAIDGCGKMSLRANIFPYGITDTEKLAVQVFGRCPIALLAGNIEAQYCDGIRRLHCCSIIEKTNCDNIQQKF